MDEATLRLILGSWSWRPSVLLGLGGLVVGYAYAFYYFWSHGWLPRLTRRGLVQKQHPWLFGAGIVVLLLALVSPLDNLGSFLLWAHMLQHILLIMVAPPLILLGLPTPFSRWFINETKTRRLLAGLSAPMVAFLLYNVNLLVWHTPALYQAALEQELLHALEHSLFFATAFLFWWRVLDPTRGWYPLWSWQPARWVYLLLAAPPSYFLGSILWASSHVLYPYYTQVPRLGDLSVLADQHAAGLLMWSQGWMFVMISMGAFFLWYNPEVEQS